MVGKKILFDTGEKGSWLLENMRNLNVDIDKIEAIVISHDHWDHWGGLWQFLEKKRGARVYICPNFGKEFKDKAIKLGAGLIDVEKLTQIAPGIFSTGEIPGAYHNKFMPEQGLLLKTENGITLITGCAHPGILKMAEKVKEKFPSEPVYLVLGGFHLLESDQRAVEIIAENFKKMQIKKVAPTHCSGKAAEEIFKNQYQENFICVKVGQAIEV